jgi:hypothetical protein
MTDRHNLPPRIIRHLRLVRDELEQVGRAPGERLEISRAQLDQMIDDIDVSARLTRELSEHRST